MLPVSPHSYSRVILQCAYVCLSQQHGVPAWGRVRLQTPPGTERTVDTANVYLVMSNSFQLNFTLAPFTKKFSEVAGTM